MTNKQMKAALDNLELCVSCLRDSTKERRWCGALSVLHEVRVTTAELIANIEPLQRTEAESYELAKGGKYGA